MFGGEIINVYDTLQKDGIYTFTYDHGRYIEYRSDNWVLDKLRHHLGRDLDIVSIERPLFGAMFAITVKPKIRAHRVYFIDAFKYAWESMGYTNAIFVRVERGRQSTVDAGGLSSAVTGMGEVIGSTLGAALKPVVTILILGGLVLWGARQKFRGK